MYLMKVQFHGFYDDQTVRDIFGDSDHESEPFEGCPFKMLDNFENNWVQIDLQFSIELFLKIM